LKYFFRFAAPADATTAPTATRAAEGEATAEEVAAAEEVEAAATEETVTAADGHRRLTTAATSGARAGAATNVRARALTLRVSFMTEPPPLDSIVFFSVFFSAGGTAICSFFSCVIDCLIGRY